MKPLIIELFAGKCGWGKGFVSEGWRHIGFDIVHEEWHRPIPEGCLLVLQDVMTLHGAQFKDADAIVASPPCQRYSYMAMPWDLSKREIRWQEWERDSPFGNFTLNDLFDACFRIQREASEAKGEYIPMVVENVKGAQRWVGGARWHFGSFYLYGDVPALMPMIKPRAKVPGLNWSGSDKRGYVAMAFNDTAVKNNGGSWFAKAHNTQSGHSHNPVSGVKGTGGSWFTPTADGRTMQGHWRDGGCVTRTFNSKDVRRKAASAAIAEIPFELSSHIARMLKP